jgi:hypothetical protein
MKRRLGDPLLPRLGFLDSKQGNGDLLKFDVLWFAGASTIALGHAGGTFSSGAQPGLTGRYCQASSPEFLSAGVQYFSIAVAPGIASQQGDSFYERLLCDTLPAALRRPYALPKHEAVLSAGHECGSGDPYRYGRKSSMACDWYRAKRAVCSPSRKRSPTPYTGRLARCLRYFCWLPIAPGR